jgi:hypothetical protein
MDCYLKLAEEYFAALESPRHYPSWRSLHWVGLVLALAVFVAAFWWTVVKQAGMSSNFHTLIMVITIGIVAWPATAIQSYKRRSLVAAAAASGGQVETIDDVRRAELTRICGLPPSEFGVLAKDCTELMALEDKHRLSAAMGARYYWNQVYASESKARVLATLLAAIALVVTLSARSLPPDYPSAVEILMDDGVWSLLSFILFAVVMLFALWIGLQIAARAFVHAARLWMAKFTSNKSTSRFALRYFLSDLVRLHQPRLAGKQSGEVQRGK